MLKTLFWVLILIISGFMIYVNMAALMSGTCGAACYAFSGVSVMCALVNFMLALSCLKKKHRVQ